MNIDIARQKMIEQQVRAWDVFDPDVLDVLGEVPRERFVPPGYESLAFADTVIPIGHGESMMTPTIEGRLLQALELGPADKVLEVGTGTGFVTACLATLARSVTSIDIHDDFLKRAATALEELGLDNAHVEKMDAMRELPGGGYDAIAVTGSVQHFDPRFVEALADGGRLFVVVGDAPVMDARVVTRTGEANWESQSLFETDLEPLVHGALPPQFSF